MICLDLGCGFNLQAGFIGLDKRKIDHPDVTQHDLETFPWPIESNTVSVVLCSHLLEHLKPWIILEFMDEIWRVCKPDAQVFISTPYGGSVGGYQDPTHVRPGFIEASFYYFDPRNPLWTIYRSKPFFIEHMSVDHGTNISVRYRCIKPGSKEISEEALKEYGTN